MASCRERGVDDKYKYFPPLVSLHTTWNSVNQVCPYNHMGGVLDKAVIMHNFDITPTVKLTS